MKTREGTGPSGWQRMRKWVLGSGALLSAWLLAVAVATIDRLPDHDQAPAHAATASVTPSAAGWGSEVLAVAREQAFEMSPFAIANACGIGASSCFKCHNGTRAAAPKSDKATDPWHPDHKTVNDSCVGCHGGNARLIKKEIAHANLVKDPRPQPDLCSKCHKSGDVAALQKTYQITGRK